MVEAINLPLEIFESILSIGVWIKTVGAFIILWIIFHIVSLIVTRKKMKELYQIKHDMKRIERKIDKLLKK